MKSKLPIRCIPEKTEDEETAEAVSQVASFVLQKAWGYAILHDVTAEEALLAVITEEATSSSP
jgi:hypothetical protein